VAVALKLFLDRGEKLGTPNWWDLYRIWTTFCKYTKTDFDYEVVEVLGQKFY